MCVCVCVCLSIYQCIHIPPSPSLPSLRPSANQCIHIPPPSLTRRHEGVSLHHRRMDQREPHILPSPTHERAGIDEERAGGGGGPSTHQEGGNVEVVEGRVEDVKGGAEGPRGALQGLWGGVVVE